MISKRVSDLSCGSDHFNKAAPDYNTALKKSGFNENTKYLPSQPKKRNRKRQIIWFNPPYSVNVKTNVGKLFMKLIDKHFPRHHKFHKLFNRNNVYIHTYYLYIYTTNVITCARFHLETTLYSYSGFISLVRLHISFRSLSSSSSVAIFVTC